MNKIKTSIWPRRNPIGDKLFLPLAFTQVWTPVIGTNQTAVSFNSTQNDFMNDVFAWINSSQWSTSGVRSAGSFQAATMFGRYICKGVKMTFRARAINAGTPTAAPWGDDLKNQMENLVNRQYLLIVRAGGSDMTTVITNPRIAGEDRWSRMGVVGTANEKPKPFSIYYNCRKVFAPMPYLDTEFEFTGATDGVGNASSFASSASLRPTDGPRLNFGIARSDGVNNPPDSFMRFEVHVDFTFYLVYFQKFVQTLA